MINKISFNEFIKETPEKLKELKIWLLKTKSIKFYPIFLLYSISIIVLLKICQLIF